MATWVIGDVHGCWLTLQRLLEAIEWSYSRDEVWMVGDLVNRGPSSLEVLRWASQHREHVTPVMGNHDLHLLARSVGAAKARAEDTLAEVLAAADRDELRGWVRTWPLLHRFGPFVMVHAGLVPEWDIEMAMHIAGAVSVEISGARGHEIFEEISAGRKQVWREGIEGYERLASAAAVFTRMRMIGPDGRARLSFSGPPGAAPENWEPWFRSSAVRRQGYTMVFGHWAQFGFYRANDVVCLDSGCVYGGRLTALCLEDGQVVQEPVADQVDEAGVA